MTQVHIEETPGGDQPIPKAEGDVLGFQTQLGEAVAYAAQARERASRVQAENEERLANAQDNVVRADAEVDRLQGEVAAAEGALAALQSEG